MHTRVRGSTTKDFTTLVATMRLLALAAMFGAAVEWNVRASVFDFFKENTECFIEKCVGDKIKQDQFRAEMSQSKEGSDVYEIVFETGSFKDLACDKGWEIINKRENSTALDDPTKIISVYGPFDAGKTYILAQLSGKNPKHGFVHVTRGISVLQQKDTHTLYLDTVGYGRAQELSKMDEVQVAEEFLQHVAVEAANSILFVVGPLTRYDQDKFTSMLEKIMHMGGCASKPVIMVHNFKEYYFQDAVDQHVQTDIIEAFDAKAQPEDTTTGARYFTSTRHATADCPGVRTERKRCFVTHVVLAREGSPAGLFWNAKTLNFVRNLLAGGGQTRALNSTIQQAAAKIAAESFMLTPPADRSSGVPYIFEEAAVVYTGVKDAGIGFIWEYVNDKLRKLLRGGNMMGSMLEFTVSISETKMNLQLVNPPPDVQLCGNMVARHKSFKFVPQYSTWTAPDTCAFVILVELPGVPEDKVKVARMSQGVVTNLVVSGNKDYPPGLLKQCTLYDCPTSAIGPFSLMIALPGGSNIAKMDKKFSNGVLQIFVPSYDDGPCVTHQEL